MALNVEQSNEWMEDGWLKLGNIDDTTTRSAAASIRNMLAGLLFCTKCNARALNIYRFEFDCVDFECPNRCNEPLTDIIPDE